MNIVRQNKNNFLKKFGTFLKTHRTVVCKENRIKFAERMTKFSKTKFTALDISQMETGNNKIIIEKWIYIWIYFQNIDKIVKACEQKDLLFLASQKEIPNIETEIFNYLNKQT